MLLEQYPQLAEDDSTHPKSIDDDICRKDTGKQSKLRKWSKGYQFIIGGGGHIEAFAPIYE